MTDESKVAGWPKTKAKRVRKSTTTELKTVPFIETETIVGHDEGAFVVSEEKWLENFVKDEVAISENTTNFLKEAHVTLDEMEVPKPSSYERKVAEMSSLGKDADEYLDDRQAALQRSSDGFLNGLIGILLWPIIAVMHLFTGNQRWPK